MICADMQRLLTDESTLLKYCGARLYVTDLLVLHSCQSSCPSAYHSTEYQARLPLASFLDECSILMTAIKGLSASIS